MAVESLTELTGDFGVPEALPNDTEALANESSSFSINRHRLTNDIDTVEQPPHKLAKQHQHHTLNCIWRIPDPVQEDGPKPKHPL